MKSKVKNSLKDNETNETQEYYIVYLAFDLIIKIILSYPYSVCSCYDGRYYYSHIGRLLLFIRYA